MSVPIDSGNGHCHALMGTGLPPATMTMTMVWIGIGVLVLSAAAFWLMAREPF